MNKLYKYIQSKIDKLCEYAPTQDTEPYLQKIFSEGMIKDDNGKEYDITISVTVEQGEYIYSLIKKYRPKVSLEIGLAYGISSLYICRGLKEVNGEKHIVIDPYQKEQFHDIGLINLIRTGYINIVDFYPYPSDQILPRLVFGGTKIDYAFIDGWHTFDYVLVDFYYIDKMLNEKGIVIFHDSELPSIRKVINFVLTHRDYVIIPWKRYWRQKVNQFEVDLVHITKLLLTFKNPYRHRIPGNRLIALQKLSNYQPNWDYFRTF
jgi:predicted O-methyltransferase YrrM